MAQGTVGRLAQRVVQGVAHQAPDTTGLSGDELPFAGGGAVKGVGQVGQGLADVEQAQRPGRLEEELDVLVEQEEGVFEAEAGLVAGRQEKGPRGAVRAW